MSPIKTIKELRPHICCTSTLFILSIIFALTVDGPTRAENIGIGGNFTLEASHGKVSLSDYEGSVVLLYFGYTQCPDICPTTLATIAASIEQIAEERRNQIQTIFISLDPERDTPESLSQYASYFHPKFIGLTGNPQTLDRVANQYGVVYRRVIDSTSSLQYSLDHSAYTYVIDRTGSISALIPHGAGIDEVATKIEAAF